MVKTGTSNLASYVYLELLKLILLLLSVDSTIAILYLEMFPTWIDTEIGSCFFKFFIY
jgi:hypothetical protein